MAEGKRDFASVDVGEKDFAELETLEAEMASMTLALIHGRITDPVALVIITQKHARKSIELRSAWMNLIRKHPVLDQEGIRAIDWIYRRITISYPACREDHGSTGGGSNL